MVRDNVKGLYDVGVFEGGANAELGGNLFLVLLFGLAGAFWPKLLDCIDHSAVLGAALDETDSAACTTAEDTAKLSVFFGEMDLGIWWSCGGRDG